MNNANALPAGFEALAPFVEQWSIAGAANRGQRRFESEEVARVAFYNAAKDLAAPALALLDQKPLAEFDDKEERLMNLLLSLAHVSLAVEVQADAESKHADFSQFMKITRAPSDIKA
jgi:hypothetical protein